MPRTWRLTPACFAACPTSTATRRLPTRRTNFLHNPGGREQAALSLASIHQWDDAPRSSKQASHRPPVYETRAAVRDPRGSQTPDVRCPAQGAPRQQIEVLHVWKHRRGFGPKFRVVSKHCRALGCFLCSPHLSPNTTLLDLRAEEIARRLHKCCCMGSRRGLLESYPRCMWLSDCGKCKVKANS